MSRLLQDGAPLFANQTLPPETGPHLRRVAEYSRLLAQLAGLDSRNTHLLFLAAPLHELGHRDFPTSASPVLGAAAIVAGQHHERWDGRGYPNGIRGEDIHIFARITAVADAFDALMHPRCSDDEEWPLKRALECLRAESGSRFDPALIELLVQNLHPFVELYNRLREPDGTIH